MQPDERRRLRPDVVEERVTGADFELQLQVPADLDVWPGHFPGRPVVPAVLQVDWAMRAACRWLGPHKLSAISALKLRRPVLPGQRLVLRLRASRSSGRVDFEFADGQHIVSSGRLALIRSGQ